LDWTTDDAALSCPLGLAFTNEEAALRTKTITTLVTIEAAFVPLAANC
jgi:CxxC motif-containing protein